MAFQRKNTQVNRNDGTGRMVGYSVDVDSFGYRGIDQSGDDDQTDIEAVCAALGTTP